MDHAATILMTGFVTHDTKRFVVSRPDGFHWNPGQGVEVVINKPPWDKKEGRPFTPTGRIADKVLEFTIKRYPDHHGVTDHLHTLNPGQQILMSNPFGAIRYKGKGIFIAAGAGITPFLAIFRDLDNQGILDGNRLIYSNKRPSDIICEKELRHYFGGNALFTCTRGKFPGYLDQRIDRTFLVGEIPETAQYFYVCGPQSFVEEVNRTLGEIGADSDTLVFEK